MRPITRPNTRKLRFVAVELKLITVHIAVFLTSTGFNLIAFRRCQWYKILRKPYVLY